MLIFVIQGAITLFVVGMIVGVLGERVKHPVSIAVNLFVIGLLFALGSLMNVEPGRPSGNGNLAWFLVIPLAALGLVLLYQLYAARLLRRFTPLALAFVLLGLLAHQAAGFDLQHARYRHLQEKAALIQRQTTASEGGYPVSLEWDSMHMNGHFFHLNTYLLFVGWIAIVAVVGLLVETLLRRRKGGALS
ncbi:hypothetical protein [Saccharibacillus endophyticus]|uniref:Uncharacterized protein n=1 Tax=Saccharibacillus endophyticus TaxID=2060666 RepID=A0ABQ1ZWL9_9BACL|nr:hypothetical protein [Saccharibacillus endophyticus]GGH79493.1 hypothetical protein GCM10007362_26370 [Saccharibacillus endophyticus]